MVLQSLHQCYRRLIHPSVIFIKMNSLNPYDMIKNMPTSCKIAPCNTYYVVKRVQWRPFIARFIIANILYSSILISLHNMLPFKLIKDTPYLALSGELWSVFYEYFNRNWSCYRGFLLYFETIMIYHQYHFFYIKYKKILAFPTKSPLITYTSNTNIYDACLYTY